MSKRPVAVHVLEQLLADLNGCSSAMPRGGIQMCCASPIRKDDWIPLRPANASASQSLQTQSQAPLTPGQFDLAS